MKTLYKYVLLLVIGLFLVSCDDFLTKNPESDYSVNIAYKTQNDFIYAINAVYAPMQNMYGDGWSWLRVMISRSDDTRPAGYEDGASTFTDSSAGVRMNEVWQYLWKMINRANLILDKIDGVTFTDTNMQSYIKGEAYGLRGWAYWMLAWEFGGMPLISTSTLSVTETKAIARSTQEETFAFAESDYKSAIGLLPDSWSGNYVGCMTKYAAEGLLARLYMFESAFSKAEPYLKDIIDSGKYKMAANYVDCFRDGCDNDPSKDRVFEVQFNGGLVGEGNSFGGNVIPEGYKGVLAPASNGSSASMRVSDDLKAAYEEGDIRKTVSIADSVIIGGVVSNETFILKYNHYDYTPQAISDWANNMPILRYTDVLMMYAECLNEEGYVANGEAFSILNQVRARAGLAAKTASELPDHDSFLKALQQERRVEFAFEGLRWPDLIRWGIAQTTMNEHFQGKNNGNGRYQMDGDYRKIYAIPFEEITRYGDDTKMWQNPNY